MIKKDVRDQLIRKAIAEVFRRASPQKLKDVFNDLSQAYGEDHRYHHTLDHIAEMLALAENHPLENAQAFKSAVLFHDYIYDPERYSPKYGNISNEDQSAIICMNALEKFGVRKDTIERAKSLIIMTKDHKAPEDDHEAALFLDLDMAVLGMHRNRYEYYARATARDFLSVFTPEDYLKGRTAFLEGQLKKETIFQTEEFASMEQVARENMTWELENLPNILTRLMQAKPTAELA